MIKSIARFIRSLRLGFRPLTVVVEWNGLHRVHTASTRAQVIDWMRYYPLGANIAVYDRFGRLLAHRPKNAGRHLP